MKGLIKIFENSLKHLLCLCVVSLANIQTFTNSHSCLDGTHTQKHKHIHQVHKHIRNEHFSSVHTFTPSHEISDITWIDIDPSRQILEFLPLCFWEKTKFLKYIRKNCKEDTPNPSMPPLDRWSFISRCGDPPFLKYKHPQGGRTWAFFWRAIPSIPSEAFTVFPVEQHNGSLRRSPARPKERWTQGQSPLGHYA